jgi:propanol-preferring alcohol dehydrogenase
MRAVLLVNPGPIEGQPLHITEIDTPEPGPGQLLVKVAACGVCRSSIAKSSTTG